MFIKFEIFKAKMLVIMYNSLENAIEVIFILLPTLGVVIFKLTLYCYHTCKDCLTVENDTDNSHKHVKTSVLISKNIGQRIVFPLFFFLLVK